MDTPEELQQSPDLRGNNFTRGPASGVQVGGELVRKIYRGDTTADEKPIGSTAEMKKDTEKSMFGFAGSIMELFTDSPKQVSTSSFKVSVSTPLKSLDRLQASSGIQNAANTPTAGFEIRPTQVAPKSSSSTNPPSTRNLPIPVLPANIFESYLEAPKLAQPLKESLAFDLSQSFHPSAFGTKSSVPTFPDTGSSGHEHKPTKDKDPEDDEEMYTHNHLGTASSASTPGNSHSL